MKLENYGMIGDLRTAALVGLDGSIDWLCLPRFDSSACFARLLGDERNGHWRISPTAEIRRTSRRYRQGTLVLETDFEADEGAVRLVDCMPPGGGRCARGRGAPRSGVDADGAGAPARLRLDDPLGAAHR